MNFLGDRHDESSHSRLHQVDGWADRVDPGFDASAFPMPFGDLLACALLTYILHWQTRRSQAETSIPIRDLEPHVGMVDPTDWVLILAPMLDTGLQPPLR